MKKKVGVGRALVGSLCVFFSCSVMVFVVSWGASHFINHNIFKGLAPEYLFLSFSPQLLPSIICGVISAIVSFCFVLTGFPALFVWLPVLISLFIVTGFLFGDLTGLVCGIIGGLISSYTSDMLDFNTSW